MVGPWPLAPHHDQLQDMHHIYILMQRGQNRGVTKSKNQKAGQEKMLSLAAVELCHLQTEHYI